MSIQDWAAIGEIVGAIAVIVTLIYLATQIRQNTRQIRCEGHARITDSYNGILSQLFGRRCVAQIDCARVPTTGKVSQPSNSQGVHLFFTPTPNAPPDGVSTPCQVCD